jgi:hypothetical protein
VARAATEAESAALEVPACVAKEAEVAVLASLAKSANEAVANGLKAFALVATEAVTSTVSGKLNVTFTSLPTFVTAVVIHL